MPTQRRGWLAICIVSLAVGSVSNSPVLADTPSPSTSTRGIPLILPGGLVIRVGGADPGADTPGTILLSAKEYAELLDRLETLQRQIDAQKPIRPRSCELDGRIEQRGRQTVVRLRAVFKVTTTRPNTVVTLGCQRAQAVDARTPDGKSPLLTADDEGLRFLADTAGDHIVQLDLDVPVTPRGLKGSELGFDIGLPGAPITVLTFEPPVGVRHYMLTTRTLRAMGAGMVPPEPDAEQPEVERFKPGKGGAPLGPITSLALAWEEPGRRAAAPPTAEGDVAVSVGLVELVTEARLRLRGPAPEWQFTAPAAADVTVGPLPGVGTVRAPELPPDRIPIVVRPEPGQTVWRVIGREPSGTDLAVTITTRQPLPKPSESTRGVYPIGPFAVLGLPQQAGVVRIRTTSAWKPTVVLKGDIRREAEDGSGELVYRYRYGELKTPPGEPPVSLTLTRLPGGVQARVRHELRLVESGWRLRSEIAVSPTRSEVEHIDIEVPIGFRPAVAEPREIIEELAAVRGGDPARSILRAALVAPKRTSFAFTLEGDYPMPAGPTEASLHLPRVLGVNERNSELLATAPSRFDLRGAFQVWEKNRPGSWETPMLVESGESGVRLYGSADRPLAIVQLSWQEAAALSDVRSEADVDLEPTRIRIAQRLHVRFTGRVPDRLHLRSDGRVHAVRVSRGSAESSGNGWDLVLPADRAREQVILLTYSVPNVLNEGRIVLPLLMPDSTASSQTVRTWAPSGWKAELASVDDWSEAATELVPDRPTLPAVVLRSQSAPSAPSIELRPGRFDGDQGPVVRRVMMDARLGDNEAAYRARYGLRGDVTEVELLFPATARGVEILVRGKRVTSLSFLSRAGEPPHVRVSLPGGAGGEEMVEARYRCAGRLLEPPTLVNAVGPTPVNWSIYPRTGSLVLVPGDTIAPWNVRSFLAVVGYRPFAGLPGEAGGFEGGGETPVLLRQSTPGPVRVMQTPRTTWVLVLSIIGFLVALGVGRQVLRHPLRIMSWVLAILVAGIFYWPQPTALVTFALLPGLTAFLVIVLAFRLVRARYRRKVARSTGFARPGSSLVRPSVIRSKDPSTRESPPAPAASAS